jgi:hypothetical protein
MCSTLLSQMHVDNVLNMYYFCSLFNDIEDLNWENYHYDYHQ